MKIALTGGIACGKSTFAKFLMELGIRVLDADDVVHDLESAHGAAVPAIVSAFGPSVLSPDGSIDRARLAQLVFPPQNGVSPATHDCGRDCLNRVVRTDNKENLLSCSAPPTRLRQSHLHADTLSARQQLEDILFPLVRSRLLAFVQDSSPSGVCPQAPVTKHQVPPPPPPPPHQAPSTKHQAPSTPFRIAIIPLLFESHFDTDYDTIIALVSPKDVQIERMMCTRGYSRAQAEARIAAQMPVAEKAARAHFVVINDSTPEHLRDEARRLVAWLKERARYE